MMREAIIPMREAIICHQGQSEAIRRNQAQSGSSRVAGCEGASRTLGRGSTKRRGTQRSSVASSVRLAEVAPSGEVRAAEGDAVARRLEVLGGVVVHVA